eukprot:6466626-Amphidinium_carterae.1
MRVHVVLSAFPTVHDAERTTTKIVQHPVQKAQLSPANHQMRAQRPARVGEAAAQYGMRLLNDAYTAAAVWLKKAGANTHKGARG